MITALSIENYRCFHKTHLEGFRLINLIGGKNNAGKTALLEAVYIFKKPHEAISKIRVFREEEANRNTNQDNSWANLFYERKTENVIQLSNKDLILRIYNSHTHELFGNDKESSYKMVFYNSGAIDSKGDYHLFDSSIFFIPSRGITPKNSFIVELYSEVRKNYPNGIQTLIEALQAIDKSIVLSEIIIDNGEPILYLQRNGEPTYPIKTYGDAMNRIAEFILRIVSNPNSLLLIDEMENGIHHETQQKIWEILFTLAIRHNVQIFATTHSLEMIKAFEKVAQSHKEEAMYVEMYKSVRTNEIAGNFHDMDLLDYELHNSLAFRGEQ